MIERRPRHYAAEIIRLPENEQSAALDHVPDNLRKATEVYVHDWPIRFRAAIHASAVITLRMTRPGRVKHLRTLPLWRRRRVIAEMQRMGEEALLLAE